MDNEVKLAKAQEKERAKNEKLRQKQLEKQRIRIHNEMQEEQKKNLKLLKRAPKDAYISLRNINKIYDNHVQAVYDFNLDIKQHEFIIFVGPSGCGKSTTLRMIAGLEDITAGDLFIDKTFANELHPKDRNIAMVFQSYALYPHMSVAGNMAFGLKNIKVPTLKVDENNQPVYEINEKAIKILKRQVNDLRKFLKGANEEEIKTIVADCEELEQKIKYLEETKVPIYENKHLPKDEIVKRVQEAAKILQISEYLDRKPKALSGGQCQRVALGRAIVKNAKLFLMDEPLSNLDAKLRVSMRSEIIKLHNRLKATTIYVTHDQTEAMTMASRIVVMNKGYIQQIGTPIEIYNKPSNIFVATFIGSPAMNLMDVKYTKNEIVFNKGTRIKLTNDFDGVVKKFYADGLEDAKHQLEKLDAEFVERKEVLEKLKVANEEEKEILQRELLVIEDSNDRRKELLNIIDKYSKINFKEGVDVVFGIRPEDIYQSNRVLTDEVTSDKIDLVVSVAELLGHEYYVHTNFEDGEIVSKIHAKTIVEPGDQIQVVFDISKIHLFDKITERLIK